MTAPREAVEAVEAALGCDEEYGDLDFQTNPSYCAEHVDGHGDHALWTDRGCPVAVAAADAAVDALGLTEETRASEGNYVVSMTGPAGGELKAFRHAEWSRLVGPWVEVTP